MTSMSHCRMSSGWVKNEIPLDTHVPLVDNDPQALAGVFDLSGQSNVVLSVASAWEMMKNKHGGQALPAPRLSHQSQRDKAASGCRSKLSHVLGLPICPITTRTPLTACSLLRQWPNLIVLSHDAVRALSGAGGLVIAACVASVSADFGSPF